MQVTLYILDDPWSKYDWRKVTEEVNAVEDIEKITGHCHKRMYCYAHNFTNNEPEKLLQLVVHYTNLYNSSISETVDWLFKLITEGVRK